MHFRCSAVVNSHLWPSSPTAPVSPEHPLGPLRTCPAHPPFPSASSAAQAGRPPAERRQTIGVRSEAKGGGR